MRTGLPVNGCAGHRLVIDDPASPVACMIAVEHFIVVSGIGHSHSISKTRHRCKIADEYESFFWSCTTTHKRDDAIIRIVWVNPGEALRIVIKFTQGRFSSVERIEIAYEGLQLGMMRITGWREQVPVEALGIVPLVPLPKLAAHKKQFLTGMAPHIAKEGPQIGEALPE